jgi:hypothetical protein
MYNTNTTLNNDSCWLNAKDSVNTEIEKYALYNNENAKENKSFGSLPTFSIDHINLRGRPGYGLSDDYLVDVYSLLRNDEGSMTRDRCPTQLNTRIFKGGPKLRGQSGNIDRELDILSGSDSRMLPSSVCSNKALMENTTYKLPPLLDYIKEVQNPTNIIQPGVRGGDDTRSYLNKIKYSRYGRYNKNLST